MSQQNTKAVEVTGYALRGIFAFSGICAVGLIGMELLDVKDRWASVELQLAIAVVFFGSGALIWFLPRLLPQFFFKPPQLNLRFADAHLNEHIISEKVQMIMNTRRTLSGYLDKQQFDKAWKMRDQLVGEIRDLKRMCRNINALKRGPT